MLFYSVKYSSNFITSAYIIDPSILIYVFGFGVENY